MSVVVRLSSKVFGSGIVGLYSHVLDGFGHDPLPNNEEPIEGHTRALETAERYPLVLSAGRQVSVYTRSRHRTLPSLRKIEPEPVAELHPETVLEHGICDGNPVTIESRRGAIKIKARVTEHIVPGVVNLVHGWEEANANLPTDHLNCDPILSTPSLRAGLCRIQKDGMTSIVLQEREPASDVC